MGDSNKACVRATAIQESVTEVIWGAASHPHPAAPRGFFSGYQWERSGEPGLLSAFARDKPPSPAGPVSEETRWN